MKKIQRGCPPYEGADPYLYFCFAEKDREAVFPLLEYLYLRGVRIWYNVEYTADIKKLNRQKVIYIMIAALLIGLTPIPQGLFASYGEMNADRAHGGEYERDAGFRIAYLVEAVFFLYVILTHYHNVSNKAKDIVMLNLALVFCAILLVFVKSENGGRLGWMFMIGVICTLSNVCVKNKMVLKQGAMMVIVSFFLFFRLCDAWGIQLFPYKTFLTDGYRQGDIIHDIYEYDFEYEKDKFYRPAFWFMEK